MENWKKIEGYDNYEVSNRGRVRSIRFGERILKTMKRPNGKDFVCFYKDRIQKFFLVEKLVYFVFNNISLDIYNVSVSHKDGDINNNNLDNLSILGDRQLITKRKRELPVGVYHSGKKYRVCISKNGLTYRLGTYDTIDEAKEVYINELKKYKKL